MSRLSPVIRSLVAKLRSRLRRRDVDRETGTFDGLWSALTRDVKGSADEAGALRLAA